MSDLHLQLDWSEEQWSTIRRAVQDTARKARVASSFLPLVGPLPSSQTTVPALNMSNVALDGAARGEAGERLSVDDADVLHLATIAAYVYVKSSEAADPDLSAALSMFSRAADVIARVEDAIIFNGQPGRAEAPKHNGHPMVQPPIYTVHGGGANVGLLTADKRKPVTVGHDDPGEHIVSAVVEAVSDLEAHGHYGPFACVLGDQLFLDASTPSRGSLILPSDRIVPFLGGGSLRRTSTIPRGDGVVVSLAGAPIDLVVGTDISVRFMQVSLEPRFVFRVYERIVLRVKQAGAVRRLQRSHPKA